MPSDAQDADILSTIRVTGLLTGLAVLLVTWFAVRLLTGSITRLGDRFTDKRLILNQFATLGRFVIYLSGIVLAVAASITLSKEVILGLTGTAAVAIGLALKDLTASVLAGIVIIIDRPFQVGDRVTFSGTYGEVTSIGLRSVRVTTLDDSVVTIPNNKFLTEVVMSGNSGALDMHIQMDFFVGLDQDVAIAKQLVEECLISNRYAYLKKPWTVHVNLIVENQMHAVRLRAKAYVLDVQYEKAFESDMTERVLIAFRTHGVMPPALLQRELRPFTPRAA